MKIYTKTGDDGTSSLFGGQKVRKDHPRLAAYGTIDETNSHLGLAIACCKDPDLEKQLQSLQHYLFVLGADLATPADSTLAARVRRINDADIAALESQIDAATAELTPLKRFILPGGSMTAGHLHVARATVRRAEREMVAQIHADPAQAISRQSLIFVNRLSDLLFTLARLANKREGIPDVEWEQNP